jgi:transforming growth factor-beta-induced protein
MNSSSRIVRWIPAVAVAVVIALGSPVSRAGSHGSGKPDIIATAIRAGSFKTLAKALAAADLVEALQGDGPFTVLAPTDEAFARLPAGTVESLLKPENKARLQAVLKYHVIAGRVAAKQVAGLDSAKTLSGAEVKVAFEDGHLRVNQARVLKTDIAAANGLIHVIDEVLLPPETTSTAATPAKGAGLEVVRLAIRRGVPLFNDGQVQACAAVYEVAALSLAERSDVPAAGRRRLRKALAEADEQKDVSARAWTLRHALDELGTMMN